MSNYYNPQRSKKYRYNKNSGEPFKISRSKIDLFMECPRCFYLDRVLGTGRPSGYPFNLNSAVDHLLKQEFDSHRAQNKQHPLIEKYGIDAKPVAHEKLDQWRENFVGVQYLHEPTNLLIFGAIDDLWIDSNDHYIVVDYKSTSTNEKITALDKAWQDSYKRQMEVYQWLLRQNGYKVSNVGYFVYCNADTDREAFDAKLEFDVTLIAYEGDDAWVERAIEGIKKCLDLDVLPQNGRDCDYCAYYEHRYLHELKTG
jgi:CRISPR/Cas system-associated exonuclease Cas4 (RecB family)